MAGFVTPVAEQHSRRYSHAGMHAWEENNTSLEDSYFEYMPTIDHIHNNRHVGFDIIMQISHVVCQGQTLK